MNASPTLFEEITQRLKANYPHCQIDQSEDGLVIHLPISEIRIHGNRVSFFVAGETFDELDYTDKADLYEKIETFLIALEEEEKDCTPAFTQATAKAAKSCRRILYGAAILSIVCLLTYHMLDLSRDFLILAVLMPLIAVIPLRIVRRRSYRRDWVCPYCGEKLPLEHGKWLPELKYVSTCPKCRCSLIDTSLIAQLRKEIREVGAAEQEDAEEIPEQYPLPPKNAGKIICIVYGILLLLFTLSFGALMFVEIKSVPLANTMWNVISLLSVGAMGIAMISLHVPQHNRSEKPIIAVWERGMLPWLGMISGVLGLFIIFISFVISSPAFESVWAVALCSLIGLFFAGLGGWMLLARKNRTLQIFRSSIIYMTSFGKQRDFTVAQIGSVRLGTSGSLKFLDRDGKKLFSIEANMMNAAAVINWIEKKKLPISTTKAFEAQAQQCSGTEEIVSWREEDLTPMHRHLKAIKVGLWLVIALFAAGCLLPLYLFVVTDLKMKHAIAMAAVTPIPMLLYYYIFAPVLLAGDRPECASKEWQSMHIKFPTIWVGILTLISASQVFYFWDRYMLQVVDFGRFALLTLAVAAVLIAVFRLRTPKRLRKSDSYFLMYALLLVLAYVMSYGAVTAISEPPEHYPAVVVDESAPRNDDDDSDYTLTVLLDDGTTAELNVPETLYELEQKGVEFVVCQKNNVLGIRLLRLHLPKGAEIP